MSADEPTSAVSEQGDGGRKKKKRMSATFGLLAAVFMLGVLAQHIVTNISGVQELGAKRLAVIVGLLAFVVVVAGGFSRTWRRYFSSNRFAVPLLFTLTALSVIGTLILQGQGPAVMNRSYGNLALAVIRGLRLDDMFHSFGFAIILGMGAGGLALVVIGRRLPGIRRMGSLIAHVGILVTLAGACVGSAWGVKGRIDLHKGQSTDRFQVPGPGGQKMQHKLGYKISLDDFKIDKYDPDYRLMVFDVSGGREKLLARTDPAKPDRKLLAKYGLKLAAYWPDHFERDVVEPLKPGEDVSGHPAAAKIEDSDKQARWMFDEGKAIGGRTELAGLRLAFFWDAQRADDYLVKLADGGAKSTHLIVVGKQRMALPVGKRVKLFGSDHSIEIKRALVDFVLDPDSHQPQNRSDKPKNPAVEVAIYDSDGKKLSSGWLFANYPDFHMQGHGGGLAGLRYEYSGAGAQAADAVLVGEKPQLLLVKDGKVDSRIPVEIGVPLAVGDKRLVVRDLYQHARHRVVDDSHGARADNPLARLEVEGSKRPIDLGPRDSSRLPGGRAVLLGLKGGEMVRDYISRVSVYQGNAKVLTRMVEVNDPLSYGGFAIYQADYRPEDPSYSGFEVVSDPGLWLVYLGIILNVAGVFWAMFLPNFLKRRRRAASAKASAKADAKAGEGDTP